MFSNHLDIGYTINSNGSSSGAVINEYFTKHFPQAIATSAAMRKEGKPQYRWMTQSWLVATYRRCRDTKVNIDGPAYPSDLICPNATALAAFEAAVLRGDITWHAFPFNAELEVYSNPVLFDTSLNLTFTEDMYFQHAPRKTFSVRDVPGVTRAAIPLLSRRGIIGVTVGENAQVAPVAVPPIFKWKDNSTGTSVIALYHALGYGRRRDRQRQRKHVYPGKGGGGGGGGGGGRDGGEGKASVVECKSNGDNAAGTDGTDGSADCSDELATLFYRDVHGDLVAKDIAEQYDDSGPSMHVKSDGTVAASRAEHCVEVHEAAVAVCTAWKIDNSGPHSPGQAAALFDAAAVLFPEATIHASDAFDDFFTAVEPHSDVLPVVTQEIGDTWMMGASSDPKKVAHFRAASRAHTACITDCGDACCLSAASADSGSVGSKVRNILGPPPPPPPQPSPKEVAALRTFERLLMTVTEHTWGWNGGDIRRHSWSNDLLNKSLHTNTQFSTAVRTWQVFALPLVILGFFNVFLYWGEAQKHRILRVPSGLFFKKRRISFLLLSFSLSKQ